MSHRIWGPLQLRDEIRDFQVCAKQSQRDLVARIQSLAVPAKRHVHINMRFSLRSEAQSRSLGRLTSAITVASVRLTELDRRVLVISDQHYNYATNFVQVAHPELLHKYKDPLAMVAWSAFQDVPPEQLIKGNPVLLFDGCIETKMKPPPWLNEFDCAFCTSIPRKRGWIDGQPVEWFHYIYEDERRELKDLTLCMLRLGFSFSPAVMYNIARFIVREEEVSERSELKFNPDPWDVLIQHHHEHYDQYL